VTASNERFDAILAAIPNEPINAQRAEATSFLLHNPIYTRSPAHHATH
jgi:hypothetical protein